MVWRFRFAPSPTGTPHIGNLHTALFSWALARALDGDFILRIEDTDEERNTADALQQMLEALAWLGLDWDEGPDVGGAHGPYIQSQRVGRHQEVVQQLVAGNHAYYGDDPEQPADSAEGQPLRLRLPRDGQTIVHDALRGPIVFDNANLEDKVLVRSDGRPLYHLAAMVDDHDMGITHVVRGDEWISSAPYHVQLYRALGWPEPVWVHLPLILNKRGEKLKKRDPEGGYLITDFQEAGYLPEALFNYLLLLGWSPADGRELIGKWEVRQQFRLERLGASPSIFDWDKLNWVNRNYLQRYGDVELAGLIRPYLEDYYGPIGNEAWLHRLTAVIRDSLDKLSDAPEAAVWAFEDSFETTAAGREALVSEAAGPVLTQLVASIAQVVVLDEPTAHSIVQHLRQQFETGQGWSARHILQPIRVALIGDVNGPPLHQIMAILGQERCLQRIAAAIRRRHQ
jgi:glutamyl-tRNA synthetase